MKKFQTIEDLAKAVGGLATHFHKAAAHHKAMHEKYATLSGMDKAHGEFLAAKHEAMDDGDAHKAYFGKAASVFKARSEHHAGIAELHKAHAEHLTALADSVGEDKDDKAAGASAAALAASAGTGGDNKTAAAPSSVVAVTSVDAMVKETTTGLVQESLAMLKSDPAVKDEIRRVVLDAVKSALGDKVVPDGIHGVIPAGKAAGLTLVPRPGAPEISSEGVDPKLKALIEA